MIWRLGAALLLVGMTAVCGGNSLGCENIVVGRVDCQMKLAISFAYFYPTRGRFCCWCAFETQTKRGKETEILSDKPEPIEPERSMPLIESSTSMGKSLTGVWSCAWGKTPIERGDSKKCYFRCVSAPTAIRLLAQNFFLYKHLPRLALRNSYLCGFQLQVNVPISRAFENNSVGFLHNSR